MLCPLSGLNATGGPTFLIYREDLYEASSSMASEIYSYGEVPLSLEILEAIVSSALKLTLPPPSEYKELEDDYDYSLKLREGISDWEYFTPIGIGPFGSEEGCFPTNEDALCPTGCNVQMRRLCEYDAFGWFYGIIVDEEGGSGVRHDEATAIINRNLFVMRGCLEYLRVWLDPSLPPRVAFTDSAPLMSLEGELYEILNSRHERRDHSRVFPSFRYGGIEKTIDPTYDLSRFFLARKGSRHTSRAIGEGLRGDELLPALYSDFQCWQAMRPDIWPSPTASATPTFMQFPISFLTDPDPFNALPTELLFEIFLHVPIRDLLSLSSASRSLRARITEPEFLSQSIKTAVLAGSEFWILPVSNIPGEEDRARSVALEWLATTRRSSDPDELQVNTQFPFHLPSFPYLTFVHACYSSDSMRNRQRLWNVVKQFDALWRDYRLNGWQRDVFVH